MAQELINVNKNCHCHIGLGNGNTLLFHMSQLINGSNTKSYRTLNKLTVSEH